MLGLGSSLHPHPEEDGVVLLRTPHDTEGPIKPTDPATRLVTDFTQQPPLTIPEHVPIDVALEHMRLTGVRALLVMRNGVVAGLVTSYDIQGSRVARFQHSANNRRREDVEVGDIMSPWDQVAVVDWRYIETAKVQDIARLFARFAGSHVVVVEHPAKGQTRVRGMISRTRTQAVQS